MGGQDGVAVGGDVLAGALVDRLPRVEVMVAADLARAGLSLSLVFLTGHSAAVYAVAFGMSLGMVLFNPVVNSTLPAVVNEDEQVAANSGVWPAAVLSQIAIASLAGLLFAGFGARRPS